MRFCHADCLALLQHPAVGVLPIQCHHQHLQVLAMLKHLFGCDAAMPAQVCATKNVLKDQAVAQKLEQEASPATQVVS